MQFRIRKPFVVHIEKVLTRHGQSVIRNGVEIRQIVKTPEVKSFYSGTPEGDCIDLDAVQARIHLHKLEPLDAEATALMLEDEERRRAGARARATAVAASAPPAPAAVVDPVVVAAAAAAAVQTLQAMGFTPPKARA